jgi:nucleotide exchange factor SIL1
MIRTVELLWLFITVTGSELICSGPEAESCYPRIFEATTDFQRVFDGQELPAGLHVRVDLESGKKEAKIVGEENIPKAVMVLEESIEGNSIEEGRVVPPRDGGASQEVFDRSVAMILEGSIDGAFADLEDIAHDLYFGLQVIESEVFEKLLEWLSPEAEYQAEAAMILGSALRNNPRALAACVARHPAILDRLLNLLPRTTTTVRVKVLYLISSLLAGPGQMDAFRWFDGNKVLRGVFKAQYAGGWDGQDVVRVRIARIAGDYAQDESWCNELGAAAERMKGDTKEAVEKARQALDGRGVCD